MQWVNQEYGGTHGTPEKTNEYGGTPGILGAVGLLVNYRNMEYERTPDTHIEYGWITRTSGTT